MSTGTALIDAVCVAVEKEVPGIGEFIDNRFRQATTFTNTSQRPFLKRAMQEAYFFQVDGKTQKDYYGVCVAETWSTQQSIQDDLFQSSGSGSLAPMTLEYFDIPRIYDQTEQGQQLINTLAKTNKIDIF